MATAPTACTSENDVTSRALASLALLALVVGCPDDPRHGLARDVVARVGDRTISRGRMLAELTWSGVARSERETERAALARGLLHKVVESEMLLVGAARDGVVVAPDDVQREVRRSAEGYPPGTFERVLVAEQMTPALFEERVLRRMTIDAYLRKVVSALPPVDEAEIVRRYEETRAQVVRPEQVLARQILVKTEEEAQHIARELKAKRMKFDDAARRFSDAPERDDGGRLGWYAKGELPDVFDLVFALAPGQISDVVASQYGFHIFELLERREQGPESRDAARPEIEADLRREREEREIALLIDRLKDQVPVIIDERALDEVVASLPKAPAITERGPDPAPNTAQLTSPARDGAPPSTTAEPARGTTPPVESTP